MDYAPFDSLKAILEKGIPQGDNILLSGPPGSGKSILAMQFLFDGLKNGENCVFFSLENDKKYIAEQMKGVGMDVDKYIAQRKMDIVLLDPVDIYVLLDDMQRHIKRLGAKRMALDSLSILSVYCASYRNLPEDLITFLEKTDRVPPISIGDSMKKQMLYTVLSKIRSLGCTAILVSELPKESRWFSRDKVSEFICDGIIILDYNVLGAEGVARTISVVKMRRSRYAEGVHEFNITDNGCVLSKG
jgi:KaiC/GvpD/RAD55 family RecA-like ATPase